MTWHNVAFFLFALVEDKSECGESDGIDCKYGKRYKL